MRTMLDLYERNAWLNPDREIYVCGGVRRTYGEFLARIRQLASALQRRGLARQDRVGILAANCIEYFEIYGACEAGSLIAAAFNFRSAVPELDYLIGHARPRILFFDTVGAAIVSQARDNAQGVEHYVFLGNPSEAQAWATPFESFLGTGDPAGPTTRPEPDEFCNLFYTSGTTGRPKGVPYTHAALVTTAERTAREEEMRLLQVTPAFHVGGRCPSLGAIWVAGRSVLHSSFDATEWLDTVEREKINVTFMVPMMIQAVLDHPGLARHDLSSLQWVMAASTAIPPSLLTRAINKLGPVFYVAYGSTESGSVTRLRRCETRADGPPEMTARLASVGQPETRIELAILDDEGSPVAQGQVGEICMVPYCFSGYWEDPEATAEAMHGRYLRTGDMGKLDERGYLFIVDRKKDMIISGGENIYSREVEDALHRHSAVQSASVFGAPDQRWGERVMAVVVLRPGHTVEETELIAFSQTQLARFKCPRSIVFVDELPLLGTGKIDKQTLRNVYASTLPIQN